jgi:hypothetical protein
MRTDDGPATSGWHGPIAMKQGKDNPKLVAINKKVIKKVLNPTCVYLIIIASFY